MEDPVKATLSVAVGQGRKRRLAPILDGPAALSREAAQLAMRVHGDRLVALPSLEGRGWGWVREARFAMA
jgi:hypothetical protein